MSRSGTADQIDPATLAAHLADTEAVAAVKRLQYAWGHYSERGDVEAMTELFAAEGRLILPEGEARGPAAIRALLGEVLEADGVRVRWMLSPVISIAPDGSRARGRWHEIALRGGRGVIDEWSGGIHENVYVRVGGAWRIDTIHLHAQFAGPHRAGWRNVDPAVPLVPFHFTPDSAGEPIPSVPAPRAAGEMDPADLSVRASEARDERLVANLIAAYGQYLDRRAWDDVGDLFAAESIFEIAGRQRRGREAIRRALEDEAPAGLRRGELHEHLQLMPIVTLDDDGQQARVRVIELQILAEHGVRAEWGVRVNEFRVARVDGVWCISHLRVTPLLLADHAAAREDGDTSHPAEAPLQGSAADFLHSVVVRRRRRAAVASPSLEDAMRDVAFCRAFDGAENVACAYGYYLDEAHWDETADLFAREGWKELSFIGTYIGRERIRDSLVARYGRRERRRDFLPIHQKTQPYISVSPDGLRAMIRLKMFQVNSGWDVAPSMITGVYEEQVVLEDGIWRIHGMDLEYVALAEWEGSWAGVRPGQARKFAPDDETIAAFVPAPDAPLRGLAFAPYPEIGPLGFHYCNPVSGREPDLLFSWSDGRFSEDAV